MAIQGFPSSWLYSQIYLAIQPGAIQPDISGYIARYIWLYSQRAIQPDISGYIANSYIARDNWLYISNLNSWPGYIARSYIARYIWLYSQIYLAIQPASQQLYSQIYCAIQPDLVCYIAKKIWPCSKKNHFFSQSNYSDSGLLFSHS